MHQIDTRDMMNRWMHDMHDSRYGVSVSGSMSAYDEEWKLRFYPDQMGVISRIQA